MQSRGLCGEQRCHREINAGTRHVEAVAGWDDEGDDPARHAKFFHPLHRQWQRGFRRRGGKAQCGRLGDSSSEFSDRNAQNQQNQCKHRRKDEQRNIAGDEELAEWHQRGNSHAAHGVGKSSAGGDGRHHHNDLGEAEHGFRQRLQDDEKWDTLWLGQHCQRGTEQQREDSNLKDLIFGDRLGDVFRENIQQNLLPGLWLRSGRDGMNRGGKRDSGARLRNVDCNCAQDEAKGGDDLKKDQGFDGHATHTAELIVARDTADDTAKDERRHDHADEAEKDIAEEVGLRGELGRVYPEFRTCKHREKCPDQQRAAAESERDEKAKGDPAKSDCELRRCVQEAFANTCDEERSGSSGKRADWNAAQNRGGCGFHRWDGWLQASHYPMNMPRIAFLECSRCHLLHDPTTPQTVCTACSGTLYVRYDLSDATGLARRALIGTSAQDKRWSGMGRYAQVLPDVEPVTLGEGWTPMLKSRRYENVWLKEEGANPTGTFKARGLALAVTMARHYGLKKLAAPSAGNAGGALAAYAAAAGIEAHIFMPKDVPLANQVECLAYSAHLTLVDGLISDCGRIVAERKAAEGWFDVSTLKERFRVEGKKTMGYELVEQLGWEYPDAVFYPTGGGVGMIGMWKAFEEMEQLGWVNGKRPRMIAIQAAGCAPVARAFEQGEHVSQMWQNAHTFASGLRVPKPYGDSIILEIVRASGGTVLALTDDQIFASLRDWAAREGLLLSPEGAAATAAYDHLLGAGFLTEKDRVVLFNTGSGNKYTDVLAAKFKEQGAFEALQR